MARKSLWLRYLSKSEFGAFGFALSAVALLQTFATLEMSNVVARFLPLYREQRDHGRLFGSIVLAISVVSASGVLCALAVAAAITMFGIRPIADQQALQLLALLALLIPFQAIDNLFTSLFATFGSARSIALRQSVLTPVLRLLLVVVLVALGADVLFLAVGYLLVALLGVLVSGWMFVGLLRDRGLLHELRGTPAVLPRS